MPMNFIKLVTKLSELAQLNAINADDFSRKFFSEIGYYAPTDDQIFRAFETLPDATQVE